MQESFAGSRELFEIKEYNNYLFSADVRSKLLITVLTSVAVIALSNIYAQVVLFVFSFIYMLSMKQYKVIADRGRV